MSKKSTESSKKNHYIELLRDYKYNCFPIKRYPPTELEQKRADYRYDASRTRLNQIIKEDENYGYIPTVNGHNCIVDIDDKEKYREWAEKRIAEGYMVIESPHGWHFPVIGLTGTISKMELFDYRVREKKIVEIQGCDHFCIGIESKIYDTETGELVTYQNRGSEKPLDVKGMDFYQFVNDLCIKLNVRSKKATSERSHYANLRNRFKQGKLPMPKSSNDYFFCAAVQCYNDGLTISGATKKIKTTYDQWTESKSFSGRPWSNIEVKIKNVYENKPLLKEGRPQGGGGLDRLQIANEYQEKRNLFSDTNTGNIFEIKNNFFEIINKSLVKDLHKDYSAMEEHDYKAILFHLLAGSKDVPKTNKENFSFTNGIVSIITHSFIETDDISDMGFKDYAYLEKTKKNEPVQWLKVMFAETPESEHTRIKAGLRAIMLGYLDSRISVIYGLSGMGKSTGLDILVNVLDQYALPIELDQLLKDPFIKAKIQGKRLVVFQDLPPEWKGFSKLKAILGEHTKSERGFHQDLTTFDNKIKCWGTANYLAEIPMNEKDSMYTRRLSLIHNKRMEPFIEDPEFAQKIIDTEGEKIISWILNLTEDECQYEDKATVRQEWEGIASPDIMYVEKYWQPSEEDKEYSANKIWRDCMEKTKMVITYPEMLKTLQNLGYNNQRGKIFNIELKPNVWVKPKRKDHKIVEDNE